MPTKEEIRQKYGITETDFTVLEQMELPKPQELNNEVAYIEKVGWWENKFEVWLKRSIIGNVLRAVILIGGVATGFEAIEKYGLIIYAGGKNVAAYVSHYEDFPKDQAKGFLVHTKTPPTAEDKQHQDMVIFSTGTSVYPVTGSWRPS